MTVIQSSEMLTVFAKGPLKIAELEPPTLNLFARAFENSATRVLQPHLPEEGGNSVDTSGVRSSLI